MAKSVDPDQTAHRNSLIRICTICSCLSVPKLGCFRNLVLIKCIDSTTIYSNLTVSFSHWTYTFQRVKICVKSNYQWSKCKRACLMTLHVNINYCRHPLQNSPLENIETISIFFLYHVKIQIIFLYRDLSLINAWCCRTDANISSLWLLYHELMLHNLPDNTMR